MAVLEEVRKAELQEGGKDMSKKCVCNEEKQGDGVFITEIYVGKNRKVYFYTNSNVKESRKIIANYLESNREKKKGNYIETCEGEKAEEAGHYSCSLYFLDDGDNSVISLGMGKSHKDEPFCAPGEVELINEIPINYCPFCGRQLRKEE